MWLILLGGWTPSVLADDVLVPAGSLWKFLDNGSDQGTAWRNPPFDDHAWASGAAQLGYGDGDETTVVNFGPNPTNRYITTYFRHAFNVANPSSYASLSLELLRDDGAVVYVNGREIFRDNMPSGTIGYRTKASSSMGGAAESTFYRATIAASNLTAGANVLAVEVHQSSTNSSDISFDLILKGIKAPMAVTLMGPANGAVSATHPPMLDVSVSHPDGTAVGVTFYGRPAGPPPGPDFTIIALPDTQYYVSSHRGGTPGIFTAQTDWIVTNKTSRNIVFVTQLGDCVENGDNGGNNVEWSHATNAMYRLEDPATTLLAHGIPYGIAVGNHDQSPSGDANGTTTFYNQYFGVPHFEGRDYYGGHYGTNNDNHYQLFSASGLDFIAVHLEWDASGQTNALQWADNLLRTHANRRAIVISHYIINSGFQASFGAQGQAIYNALKANPNLFLMLCGHVAPEEGQRTDIFNGHSVYTLMSDYQSRTNGGDGWLRILEFSPSNNVIRVKTYSPTLGRFETDADSEFTLDYDMSAGGAFAAIGANVAVPSGSHTSAAWPGLASGADYEWCVTVSDGTNTLTSPMWRFRAATNSPPIAADLLRVALQFDRANGRVWITWTNQPGTTYRVVYKSSLSESVWTDLSEDLVIDGAAASWWEPMMPSVPQRFYAVRVVR